MGKHVFVTVGTTKFDPLVCAIDDAMVLETLYHKGFTSLLVQIGHGEHMPTFPTEVSYKKHDLPDSPCLRNAHGYVAALRDVHVVEIDMRASTYCCCTVSNLATYPRYVVFGDEVGFAAQNRPQQ